MASIPVPSKQQKFDIDGEETLSRTLVDLLNTFPGMNGRKVCFSTLGNDAGIGFFPLSGAVVTREEKDITGTVYQTCQYPFFIIYRSSPQNESAKILIKEFLDTIGKWVERQTVSIDGKQILLEHYPDLEGNRKIKSVARTTPAYLDNANDDGIEDWSVSVTCTYTNQFELMR